MNDNLTLDLLEKIEDKLLQLSEQYVGREQRLIANIAACIGSTVVDQREAQAVVCIAVGPDTSIGDYAHNKSTGPAVPDGYWEIRSMAYEGSAPNSEVQP